MSKITYRPDLTPDRRYDSKGKTINTYKKVQEDTEVQQSLLEEVESLVEDIKAYDVIIPTTLKPLCNTIVSAIEFIYYYVDPEKIENDGGQVIQTIVKPPTTEWEPSGKEDEEDEDDEEEIVLSKYQPSFIIRVKDPNLVDQIEYDYYNSLLHLAKHHSLKYRDQLNNYYVSILSILKDTEGLTFSNISKEYKYPPLHFNKENNKHLSDHIIRSQIVRDQKIRMGKKLFNNIETMNIVKACESSKELLKKYVKEEFEKDEDQQKFFKNMALQDSINMYQEKIDINLMEFYKYLTTSNELLKECLEMSSNEMRSKSILFEEEGVTL